MKERIGEVILHLGLQTRPLRSGKYAVAIRVQHRSRNRYYSCRWEMSRHEWERFNGCPPADHPVLIQYQAFKEAALKLVKASDFSFDKLSALTGRRHGESLQEAVTAVRDEYTAACKHNTASTYGALLTALDDYSGKAPVPLSRVSEEFCRDFIKWLADKRGNGPTTVSMRARTLSAVLERAVKAHALDKNPMLPVRKPQARRRDLHLSVTSLGKLLHASREDIGDGNWRWLCYWRASYFGNGMNVRDLLLLDRDALRIGPDGAEIVFIRHKTEDSSGKTVHVPLLPELADALMEIGPGTGHLVPDLDGTVPGSLEEHRAIRQCIKNINVHMKDICRILRIPEKVTTYSARHTFATRLQQAGTPVEYISEALGHTRIRTTQNYLDGYTNQQRRSVAELLKI